MLDFNDFLFPDALPKWLYGGIIIALVIAGAALGWFIGLGSSDGLANHIGGALAGAGLGALCGVIFAAYIVFGLILLVILAAMFVYQSMFGSA